MTAALYHLRDSFWVESLPADPEIPDATSKVVVVGLLPGNRPLPSSMSTYSKCPASARRERTATEHVQNGPQAGPSGRPIGEPSRSHSPNLPGAWLLDVTGVEQVLSRVQEV